MPRVDGEALEAVELDDARPTGRLVEHEDALLRVVARIEDENPKPERFAVLFVAQLEFTRPEDQAPAWGSRRRRHGD